jgi:hypothetical protein
MRWQCRKDDGFTFASALYGVMADRLDPVAVGIPEERPVIGCVIIAQARRTVVAAAGGDAGVPEGIDLGPPLRLEAPVAAKGLVGFGALADGEVDAFRMGCARAFAIAQPVIAAADLTISSAFMIAS